MGALARSNDRLEHALLWSWLNAAPLGMCVLDDTSRAVMINAAAARLLQVTPTEALEMPAARLFRLLQHSPSLVQWLGTPGFDGNKQVVLPGGDPPTALMLNAQSLAGPDGARFKVITLTDVTELLAAQGAVENHKRQFAAMSAGVVIVQAHGDMAIEYVNPAFERMTGYSAAEVMGRNCRFLQGPQQAQAGVATIRSAIRQQRNGYARLRNFRKDGSAFVNELFIAPVKDKRGDVTHFIGVQHLRDDLLPEGERTHV